MGREITIDGQEVTGITIDGQEVLIGDYETEIQVNGSTEETFNQSDDATYDVNVNVDAEWSGRDTDSDSTDDRFRDFSPSGTYYYNIYIEVDARDAEPNESATNTVSVEDGDGNQIASETKPEGATYLWEFTFPGANDIGNISLSLGALFGDDVEIFISGYSSKTGTISSTSVTKNP